MAGRPAPRYMCFKELSYRLPLHCTRLALPSSDTNGCLWVPLDLDRVSPRVFSWDVPAPRYKYFKEPGYQVLHLFMRLTSPSSDPNRYYWDTPQLESVSPSAYGATPHTPLSTQFPRLGPPCFGLFTLAACQHVPWIRLNLQRVPSSVPSVSKPLRLASIP